MASARSFAVTASLVGPALVLMTVFVIGPVSLVGVLSLFNFDPLRGTIGFVGLENYRRVTESGELQNALLNTLWYSIMTIPVTIGLGLLVALGIHAATRGKSFWRAVYFMPVVSTLAALSVAWRWVFYPETGILDSTFGQLIGQTDWLNSTTLALPAVAIVGNWEGIGVAVVLFMAGLSGVPASLHEAAAIDGAGAWNRFWHVTWPALGPATVFIVVLSTRNALRVFDQVRVMTAGGPVGSTETLSYLLWERGIHFLDVGGGSVVNLTLLVLVGAVALVQFRTFGQRLERQGAR